MRRQDGLFLCEVPSMGALVFKRLACDTAGVTGQQSSGTSSSDSTALFSPVHMQVENISLQEGETITVEGLGGPDPLPLANQSFLLRGQVIRSPTHQAALRFQSLPLSAGPGTFHFRYQGKAQATERGASHDWLFSWVSLMSSQSGSGRS